MTGPTARAIFRRFVALIATFAAKAHRSAWEMSRGTYLAPQLMREFPRPFNGMNLKRQVFSDNFCLQCSVLLAPDQRLEKKSPDERISDTLGASKKRACY